MTDSVIAWLALALALFWSVGAYNRLVRLRSQAIAAFRVLSDPLGRYSALVDERPKSATVLGSEPQLSLPAGEALTAWAGLQAASNQFDASLRVARKQALDANGIAALQTALAVLQAAWKRVLEQSLDHQHLLPPAYQSQWAENNQLVSHASAGFNRAVLAYNAAIAQFPALLMARLFAFRPAGCL